MEDRIETLIWVAEEQFKDNEVATIKVLPETIQTIKNLLKENEELHKIEQEHQLTNGELRERVKELEEENKIMKNRQGIGKITELSGENLDKVLSKWCIPKSKIKEKIDYLEKQLHCGQYIPGLGIELLGYEGAIKVLQELL